MAKESDAMVTFQLNLDGLLELVARVDGAIDEYNRTELLAARDRLTTARLEDDIYEVGRLLGRNLKTEGAFRFQLQWYAVMLVTFTETYLQDALSEAAATDPTLMGDSDQAATYADVVGADSLEALATMLRDRWSRNFVNSGGPVVLLDRLTRMGARGYREDLGVTLEELWGVRHAVVHNAGRRTAELARRHPSVQYSKSDRIIVSGESFQRYAVAAIDFVKATEKYLMRRVAAASSASSE